MQEVIRELDSAATEAVKNPNDIGYTLGVVTRSGLAWTKSYGSASRSIRTANIRFSAKGRTAFTTACAHRVPAARTVPHNTTGPPADSAIDTCSVMDSPTRLYPDTPPDNQPNAMAVRAYQRWLRRPQHAR